MEEKKQSFEEALARLEALVRELEEGNIDLEKSLQLYAEAISLSKFCHGALEEAETRIAILEESESGIVLRDIEENSGRSINGLYK